MHCLSTGHLLQPRMSKNRLEVSSPDLRTHSCCIRCNAFRENRWLLVCIPDVRNACSMAMPWGCYRSGLGIGSCTRSACSGSPLAIPNCDCCSRPSARAIVRRMAKRKSRDPELRQLPQLRVRQDSELPQLRGHLRKSSIRQHCAHTQRYRTTAAILLRACHSQGFDYYDPCSQWCQIGVRLWMQI